MDLLCPSQVDYLDIDENATEIDDPLLELYQDLIHRLFEAPGSNLDDLDRGVGIEDLLGSGITTSSNPVTGILRPDQQIAHRIEQDFRKDPRVQAVQANVVVTSPADTSPITFRIQVNVECNEGVLGITLESDGAGGVVVVPPGRGF